MVDGLSIKNHTVQYMKLSNRILEGLKFLVLDNRTLQKAYLVNVCKESRLVC